MPQTQSSQLKPKPIDSIASSLDLNSLSHSLRRGKQHATKLDSDFSNLQKRYHLLLKLKQESEQSLEKQRNEIAQEFRQSTAQVDSLKVLLSQKQTLNQQLL